MNDMSAVIIPKSDQWNADDFIAGPMTFTIKEVRISAGSEQPVSIVLEGTDKFYRPCKSMSRVLVQAWGADAKAYVGKSLTLYRDPTVKWAGMEIGGIRISHMSDIDGPKQMMLTATKGSRKPFKVMPLVAPQQSQSSDFSGQLAELRSIAKPGNMDALGAKWQEIGPEARKALAAELPALKAACNAPAEDVPFNADPDEPATEPQPNPPQVNDQSGPLAEGNASTAHTLTPTLAKITAAFDDRELAAIEKDTEAMRETLSPDEEARLDEAFATKRAGLREGAEA